MAREELASYDESQRAELAAYDEGSHSLVRPTHATMAAHALCSCPEPREDWAALLTKTNVRPCEGSQPGSFRNTSGTPAQPGKPEHRF